MTAQRRWTRKRTYGADREEWVVLRDGVVVGRVMLDEQREHQRLQTSRRISDWEIPPQCTKR